MNNEREALLLAQHRYGPGTSIRSRMENGKAIWWVDHGRHDQAVIAPDLKTLIQMLTPPATAANMGSQQEAKLSHNSTQGHLITSDQAAQMLNVSRTMLHRLTRDGAVRAAGYGPKRTLMFNREDIEPLVGNVRKRAPYKRRWHRKPENAAPSPSEIKRMGKRAPQRQHSNPLPLAASKRTPGTGVRPDHHSGRGAERIQINLGGMNRATLQRAEALAAHIRSTTVFARYVTASQVLVEAILLGLPLLEKEHRK